MPITDVCECRNWPKSSRTTRKEIKRREGLDILQVVIFGSSFPNTFFGVRFAQYDCCIRTLEQRGSIWSTVGQVERYEYRQTEWLHILTNWIRKWTYRNGDYVQPTRWSFSGPRLNLTQMKTADNVGIIFRQPQTNSQTWSGLFKTSKVPFTGKLIVDNAMAPIIFISSFSTYARLIDHFLLRWPSGHVSMQLKNKTKGALTPGSIAITASARVALIRLMMVYRVHFYNHS